MTVHTLESLRFPIGRFTFGGTFTAEDNEHNISRIEALPAKLEAFVSKLDDEQLDTQYRPDGWTARQVVHHLVDSHVNSYVRFKLALTEENPTIRPYDEAAWAELPDGKALDVSVSLSLLSGLHPRWVAMLRKMKPEDFKRTFFHPEHSKTFPLDDILAMYAWHGDHHFEHIHQLALRNNW
jgi:hypothetical protein